MAEITYQMVLSTLQTVGLLIGIFYYVMTLRNAEKARELTQQSQVHANETRRIQFIYEINQYMREPGSNQRWNNVMAMEWEDYDDFVTKYGWENNPEIADQRVNLFRMLNFQGLLIQDGIIDISTYIRYAGESSPLFWNKYRSIIEEMRVLMDNPDMYSGIEALAIETDKYRASKGLRSKLLSTVAY